MAERHAQPLICWLKDRKKDASIIDLAEREYCQDLSYAKPKTILSQVIAWRHVTGGESHKQPVDPFRRIFPTRELFDQPMVSNSGRTSVKSDREP